MVHSEATARQTKEDCCDMNCPKLPRPFSELPMTSAQQTAVGDSFFYLFVFSVFQNSFVPTSFKDAFVTFSGFSFHRNTFQF